VRYSEILVENRRFLPSPPLFGAFRRDLWHQKTSHAGIVPKRPFWYNTGVWRTDGRTDWQQTQRHTTTEYTALAQRHAVKIADFIDFWYVKSWENFTSETFKLASSFVICTSYYSRCLRIKQTVTVTANLPTTSEKCHQTILWNAELVLKVNF